MCFVIINNIIVIVVCINIKIVIGKINIAIRKNRWWGGVYKLLLLATLLKRVLM